jgi:hypothetical protein
LGEALSNAENGQDQRKSHERATADTSPRETHTLSPSSAAHERAMLSPLRLSNRTIPGMRCSNRRNQCEKAILKMRIAVQIGRPLY